MAKESTAIANLLEIEARRPIQRESGDNLLFAPPRETAEAPKAKPPRARSVRELLAASKVHDTHQLTHRIHRFQLHDARTPLLAGALVLGGLAFGLTVYKISRSGTANAAVAAAAVAPAPPPKPIQVEPLVVAPPPPPVATPKPALVDVVLESRPAGATVKLGSQIAGTTPLSLSVDQAKDLDVTFAYDGQAKTVHVDPHTMKHVTVELAVVEPDPIVRPSGSPEVRKARAATPAKRASGGTGTLMISTKPPCDIAIDGASTGLTAPQKAITVAAGHHQITLTNKAQHVKKVVAVDVAANHATRVIKDFM